MSHLPSWQWKQLIKEATMGNGSPANGIWAHMLAKHGPWALGCTVLGVAFYTFALQPMAKDRQMFVEALQQSVLEQTQSWRAIADSTERISDSVLIQQDSITQLESIVREVSEDIITEPTRVKMEKFIDTILETYPHHMKRLDEIHNLIERQDNGIE